MLSLGALIHGYGTCPRLLWVYNFVMISGFFFWMAATHPQRVFVSGYVYVLVLPLFCLGFISVNGVQPECALGFEAGVVNLVLNGCAMVLWLFVDHTAHYPCVVRTCRRCF